MTPTRGRPASFGHSPRRRWATLIVVIASLLALGGAFGARALAADDARAIVAEAQRRADASSERYEGHLQVFDAKGTIAEKRWIFERLGLYTQSKALLRFTAPAEVKGVALLIVNHGRASDEWMWTPSLERERRIALQDRSTRFFGTDFTFEDFEAPDLATYTYTLEGEEAIAGAVCWRIQSRPTAGTGAPDAWSVLWIRKDSYAVARVDRYEKNEPVRRLIYDHIENIQGIWAGQQVEVTDLRRGSHTRLTLEHRQYNVPLKDEAFTLEALRRIG